MDTILGSYDNGLYIMLPSRGWKGFSLPRGLGLPGREGGQVSVTDDLVLLAIVIAIAVVVLVGFLVALYLWALARRRERDADGGDEVIEPGPFDTP